MRQTDWAKRNLELAGLLKKDSAYEGMLGEAVLRLLELHQKFGYRFIIETHSEYMIRKAQYLVAKDNKCQDDFKIYIDTWIAKTQLSNQTAGSKKSVRNQTKKTRKSRK